jgi:hypothetical protein
MADEIDRAGVALDSILASKENLEVRTLRPDIAVLAALHCANGRDLTPKASTSARRGATGAITSSALITTCGELGAFESSSTAGVCSHLASTLVQARPTASSLALLPDF